MLKETGPLLRLPLPKKLMGWLQLVTETGVFATVLSFTGTGGVARGAVPQQLVRHGDGNFYGTTAAGGAGG